MEKQRTRILALQQSYFECYEVLLEKFGGKDFSGKEGWKTLRDAGCKYKIFHFLLYNIFEKVEKERGGVKYQIFRIKSDLLVVNACTRDLAYMVNSFFKEKQSTEDRRNRRRDASIASAEFYVIDKQVEYFYKIKKIEEKLQKKQQALQLIKQLIE